MIYDYIFYRQDSCHICKNNITKNYICQDCLDKLEFLDGNFKISKGIVYYPLFYNNVVKSIIKRFKFERQTYLAKPLALIMYEYIKTKPHLMEVDFLTYVDMDPKSLFERGYNQADLLCKELSQYLGKEVISIAKKKKKTKEQNKSNLLERKNNLSSSYKAEKRLDLQGKKILLIDDLVTTGSTLEAVSKAILEENDLEIKFLTLSSSRIDEKGD